MTITDEWKMKMLGIYLMEFYSAVAKNEFLNFGGKMYGS